MSARVEQAHKQLRVLASELEDVINTKADAATSVSTVALRQALEEVHTAVGATVSVCCRMQCGSRTLDAMQQFYFGCHEALVPAFAPTL